MSSKTTPLQKKRPLALSPPRPLQPNNDNHNNRLSPTLAFKRLRVTDKDQPNYLRSANDDDVRDWHLRTRDVDAAATAREQRQQLLANNRRSRYTTDPDPASILNVDGLNLDGKATATNQDYNYQPVNSFLGELHRQRQLRLDRTAPLQRKQSPSPASLDAANVRSNELFQTPPKRSNRKVVHLHTNSKLG